MSVLSLRTMEGAHIGFVLFATMPERSFPDLGTYDFILQPLPSDPALLDDPAFTALFEYRRQEFSGELAEDAGRLSLRATLPDAFSFAVGLTNDGKGSWSLERAGETHRGLCDRGARKATDAKAV